jgi:hypothetical protein
VASVVALHRGAGVPADVPCFAVSCIATVRRDGGPRLHPFCPILAGGRLFGGIPRSSPKGWDLRRDPRCVIHALPGPEDDEFCVRASASEVTGDSSARALVHAVVVTSGVGGMIESVSRDPSSSSTSSKSTSRGGSISAGLALVLSAGNGEPPEVAGGRGKRHRRPLPRIEADPDRQEGHFVPASGVQEAVLVVRVTTLIACQACGDG